MNKMITCLHNSNIYCCHSLASQKYITQRQPKGTEKWYRENYRQQRSRHANLIEVSIITENRLSCDIKIIKRSISESLWTNWTGKIDLMFFAFQNSEQYEWKLAHSLLAKRWKAMRTCNLLTSKPQVANCI